MDGRQPIVFSHGWPLSADAWDAQMLFFGQRGYRVIAHDRRGHGRSDQTWDGNHMDTYADDLAAVMDASRPQGCHHGRPLDRRWRSHPLPRPPRHASAWPRPCCSAPCRRLMLKTDKNPGGLPLSVFDGIREGVTKDRSQFFKDLTLPFYGYNRPGAKISEGVQLEFWRQA